MLWEQCSPSRMINAAGGVLGNPVVPVTALRTMNGRDEEADYKLLRDRTTATAHVVDEWVTAIGLRREDYGTHSLRRTKAAMIYKTTGNLRAIQILLGHTKIENTVRYLGVDIEDALELAEHTEI